MQLKKCKVVLYLAKTVHSNCWRGFIYNWRQYFEVSENRSVGLVWMIKIWCTDFFNNLPCQGYRCADQHQSRTGGWNRKGFEVPKSVMLLWMCFYSSLTTAELKGVLVLNLFFSHFPMPSKLCFSPWGTFFCRQNIFYFQPTLTIDIHFPMCDAILPQQTLF